MATTRSVNSEEDDDDDFAIQPSAATLAARAAQAAGGSAPTPGGKRARDPSESSLSSGSIDYETECATMELLLAEQGYSSELDASIMKVIRDCRLSITDFRVWLDCMRSWSKRDRMKHPTFYDETALLADDDDDETEDHRADPPFHVCLKFLSSVQVIHIAQRVRLDGPSASSALVIAEPNKKAIQDFAKQEFFGDKCGRFAASKNDNPRADAAIIKLSGRLELVHYNPEEAEAIRANPARWRKCEELVRKAHDDMRNMIKRKLKDLMPSAQNKTWKDIGEAMFQGIVPAAEVTPHHWRLVGMLIAYADVIPVRTADDKPIPEWWTLVDKKFEGLAKKLASDDPVKVANAKETIKTCLENAKNRVTKKDEVPLGINNCWESFR